MLIRANLLGSMINRYRSFLSTGWPFRRPVDVPGGKARVLAGKLDFVCIALY